ncbi:copper resistance protein NlpE N-terminal domain-containing protein [Pedobacter cryoconitis]|uniref:NlpE-like protein n=1 Tax=Pedobacter cryoconitis TaxID=188932 RepID=A0A7X0J4U8_9SPHI|nr:copper resistance protein NlpE N-terminal domain-containing protein [Pedobacter cryoconitis]MBB6500694.1 hypothetical protein [Pedobacter cryoconitis]
MNTKIMYAAILAAVVSLTSACHSSKNAAQTATDSTATTTTTATPAAFTVGTFTGEVPVGKMKSAVEVTFNADSSFTLKEVYKGADNKPAPSMDSKGKWKYDATAKKIYLAYTNLMDRGTSFSVVDEKTIQMHDGSDHTKQTEGNEYNLTRK